MADESPQTESEDTLFTDIGKGLLDEQMGPSSALAHLYRGEVHRMKLWRERLDRTTNWSVIVMAAVLTWSFSSQENPHYVILAGIAALSIFLTIEARRYRGYDIWRSRVRCLQRNVFAPGLDPTTDPVNPNWRQDLSQDYRTPTLKITMEEALAHRLRRVYLPLFGVILGAWTARVVVFGDQPWPESAAIGQLPGTMVSMFVGLFFLGLIFIAIRPRTWHTHDEMRTEALRRDRTNRRR
ncbi:DUF2270 domain-containing protein [Haladaptatus sp. GCM10025707]|uniref:DUF2270 domain-containing protein n=1 Tax=unclassified Haladaptatus TaxID=2622732 RepID=UPI0023E7BE23|nr:MULTISPECIES: DUF2270 domain-containing protein [unclassified Haladaptatus]